MTNFKKLIYEVLTRVLGFFIFLVLLGIANVLTYYISNVIFLSVVSFLNVNIWLIITFSIILLIGEIFGLLMFPLNIPSPLFNAVGGIFLVQFIFKLFNYIIEILSVKINFGLSLSAIENLVIIAVFVIVLIVGYVHIIIDATKAKKKKHLHNEEDGRVKRKKRE